MKDKILKYIQENNGKHLIDIIKEFKSANVFTINYLLTDLEQEKEIVLIADIGYCKLNQKLSSTGE